MASSIVYAADCVGCVGPQMTNAINLTTQQNVLTLQKNSVVQFKVGSVAYDVTITSVIKSGRADMVMTPKGGKFYLIISESYIVNTLNTNADGVEVTLIDIDSVGRAIMGFRLVPNHNKLVQSKDAAAACEPKVVIQPSVCPTQPAPTCPQVTCPEVKCTACQAGPSIPSVTQVSVPNTNNTNSTSNAAIAVGIAGGVFLSGLLVLLLLWIILKN